MNQERLWEGGSILSTHTHATTNYISTNVYSGVREKKGFTTADRTR